MRWAALLLLLQAQGEDVESLVRSLGDASPEIREKAQRALLDRGDAALPLLRKAAEDADPEILARARKIAHRIEWEPAINPMVFSRYPDLRRIFDEGDLQAFMEACRTGRALNGLLQEGLEAFLIKALGHPDPRVQRAATFELRLLNDRPGLNPRRPIGPLLGLIARWDGSLDPEEHWLRATSELVLSLATSVDREAIERARADRPEAEKALQLLRAAVGAESARAAVLDAIESETGWRRELAIRVSGQTRLPGAAPLLVRLLRHPTLRWHALQAYSEVAEASTRDAFLEVLRQTPPLERNRLHFTTLSKVGGREAAPILLQALAIPDQREPAALALADLGILEGFEPLCTLVNSDRDGHVIASCALRLATPGTVGHLLEALDAHPRAPWAALRGAQDPELRRFVIARFRKEERPGIRRGLFDCFSYSELGKTPEGLETLTAIAERPENPLAVETSMMLLKGRGREALPLAEEAIRRAADPPWPHVRTLKHYADDRMVPTMERLSEKASTGSAAVEYLETLATPTAQAALARIASGSKNPWLRHAAASSLAWAGGDARDLLARALAERTAVQHQYAPPDRLGDLLEADEPGLRDELRRQVKAQGVRPFLSLLSRWAHPDMAPELQGLFAESQKSIGRRIAMEEMEWGICGMGRTVDATGWQSLEALGATGDRAHVAFFLDRLRDPDPKHQEVAIRTLGRWRAAEAVPALRRLVESGGFFTRMQAIQALAQIGVPGTAGFLKEHLRATPDAAAHALARLGVDARRDVLPLLADRYDDTRLLGALDLMANPKAFRNLDLPLPRRASRWVAELPALVEEITGTPARPSAGVLKALEDEDLLWYDWTVRTLRDALDMMGAYSHGPRLGHVTRDGAIEICLLDEARRFWTERRNSCNDPHLDR